MSQRYIKRYIVIYLVIYPSPFCPLEVYFQILLKNLIYPTVFCPKGILVTTGLRYIKRYISNTRYLKPRTFLLEKKREKKGKRKMITRIYVIRCTTPGHWYVGQTTRLPWERLAEHKSDKGSMWTRKHGTDCMVFSAIVPNEQADTLESQLCAVLMARYGWGTVRGGSHMYSRPGCNREKFWLPTAFRTASFADILKLRGSRVTHLGPQLCRLVDLFRRFRDAKHPNHLHAEPLP